MLFKLHVHQYLSEVKMNLVNILYKRSVFVVFVLCAELVNCVENKMAHLVVVSVIWSRLHIHECINYFPNFLLALT